MEGLRQFVQLPDDFDQLRFKLQLVFAPLLDDFLILVHGVAFDRDFM